MIIFYITKYQKLLLKFIFTATLVLPGSAFSGATVPGASIPGASKPVLSLPNLTSTDSVVPEADSTLSTASTCGNNKQAEKLAKLIQSNKNQQRSVLICNEKLNAIALIKAKLIQQNQHVWHNAGHLSPNQLLRHHGFKLPKTYPIFGNQVEAIAGGEADPEYLLKDFLNSSAHRQLLFGEDNFFKSQDQIGVAHIHDLNSDHQDYWVVIIAGQEIQRFKQITVSEVEVEPPTVSNNRRRLQEMKRRMYRNKVRSQWQQ